MEPVPLCFCQSGWILFVLAESVSEGFLVLEFRRFRLDKLQYFLRGAQPLVRFFFVGMLQFRNFLLCCCLEFEQCLRRFF